MVIGFSGVDELHDGSLDAPEPAGVYPNRNECPNLPSIKTSPKNGCNEPTSVRSTNPSPKSTEESPPSEFGFPADVEL